MQPASKAYREGSFLLGGVYSYLCKYKAFSIGKACQLLPITIDNLRISAQMKGSRGHKLAQEAGHARHLTSCIDQNYRRLQVSGIQHG